MKMISQIWDNASAIMDIEISVPASRWKLKTFLFLWGVWFIYVHKGSFILLWVASFVEAVRHWIFG